MEILEVGTRKTVAASPSRDVLAEYVGSFALSKSLAELSNKYFFAPELRALVTQASYEHPQTKVR